MGPTPVRVGIYARISEDRDGQQTATSRQLEDCRGLAVRRGWEVVAEFENVDISAYDRRAGRPEFDRLLEALRDGEIEGVIVWKLDRLTRQQRDLVRVMEACEARKAFVASVMEPIDTRETYGQFVAELLVAQARMESAHSSARQKRKAAELVKLGRPSTGGGDPAHFQKPRRMSGMTEELPEGTVTLVFTDIIGSTALTHRDGD